MSAPTCEQRIERNLAEQEERLSVVWARVDHDANDDQVTVYEELEPLSVETKRVMRLMFSCGGPSDWIEADLERTKHGYAVAGMSYHFADWFDHAERGVSQGEAPSLWRLAEYYAECVGEE
jgi:hypothetical protein